MAIVGLADVARRADRHVELAVGAEGDEPAAVVRLRREAVGDDDRRRRLREVVVDGVEAQDARDRADVERCRRARRLRSAAARPLATMCTVPAPPAPYSTA